MFNKCIILCFATIISFTFCLEEVPEYIQVCHNDEKATQCVIESVERLRPYLVQGIPELDIPSIEPLRLGHLLISESKTPNGLTITTEDLRVFGSSDFKINKLNIIRYGEEYHYDILFPNLYVDGAYNVNGKMLLFPIKGSGKFMGNFTSCRGNSKVILAKPSSNDEIVKIIKTNLKIKLGNGHIQLENLFNGDKILGETVNNVINQNFELISKDIMPLVEKSLQRMFKKMGNKICNRYTYSQLFPQT